ncbi:MAG TPA: hypothetical protein VKA00_02695 [Trueperaceae bacterium]|nr:hypothetical protein [Trueperaceae bacterium]
MKHTLSKTLIGLGIASLLVLAACSGPTFDPTGNYTGTGTSGGSSFPITATISSTSSANTWDLSITSSGGTFAGTCAHAPSGAEGNLSCTFDYASGTVVFAGTVTGNTYSGTFTDTGGAGGTFTLTRS